MLEDSIFTNRVTREQLSKKFPNKVNIGFGLDANKIKGVDNFPIYKEAVEFHSKAKSNIDTYMFTSRQREYDVVVPKHTLSTNEIRPHYFNNHMDSIHTESNEWMRPGVMSSLYGLPPDKDIIIEIPTAQAMNMMGGQMTEEKMRNHIAHKEGSSTASDDFLNDPRVKSIIEGTESSVPIQESAESITENVKESSRSSKKTEEEIMVEPAFKETTSGSSDEEEEEIKDEKNYDSEISKIKNMLENFKANPDDKDTTQHKEISDILDELNFKRPDGKIKVNSKFIEQVEEILAGKRKKKVNPSKEYENTEEDRRRKYEIASLKRDSLDDEMHFEKTP